LAQDRKAYNRKYYIANRDRHIANSLAWDAAHPTASRERGWRRRGINLTWEQFLRKLANQGYKCAICKEPIGEEAHVDHDHATEKVRGLLCSRCNVGMGGFNDDPELLRVAARYLSYWSGIQTRKHTYRRNGKPVREEEYTEEGA